MNEVVYYTMYYKLLHHESTSLGTTNSYTFFFKKKKHFFLPEPQHKAEKHRNKAEIFLNFLLTFISLFSLIIYLVKSSTNNERHVLTYMSTRVSNLTTYICFIIVLIYYHGFTITIMV